MANITENEPRHSYETFAAVTEPLDRALLEMAPRVQRATIFAPGPGEDFLKLRDLGKLAPGAQLTGVDLDETAIARAQELMAAEGMGESVQLIHGNAEDVPAIATASQELVIALNFIHNADARKVIAEAGRILQPGGVFMMNTAYEKTGAFPPGTAIIWGSVVAGARRTLKETAGITEFAKPVDLLRHSADDYRTMIEEAGFLPPLTWHTDVELDQAALEAICGYREFALGAMPGIDPELSTRALIDAVGPTLTRANRQSAPRGWFSVVATRA